EDKGSKVSFPGNWDRTRVAEYTSFNPIKDKKKSMYQDIPVDLNKVRATTIKK
ncbi:hypothetical protein L9F63_022753, partial [Diploptera punctata]